MSLIFGLIVLVGVAFIPGTNADASPSISTPYPVRIAYATAAGPCDAGNDCNWVYDPVTNFYMKVDLYYCATYYLSSWESGGWVRNNQIGGTILAYSMDSSGGLYQGWYNDNTIWNANWNPAWSIRNC